MNYNIPQFKAVVRKSWFTKNEEDYNSFDNVYVFALQSVSSKILTFHVMTDYGMLMCGVLFCSIPTMIVFFVLQKQFAEGITGAVK